MAVEIGTYSVSFDSPDGKAKDDGKYTVVWQNSGSGWHILSDTWNSNNPLPEPQATNVVADASDMGVMAATALQWAPLELPGFKSGIQLAVIHGDPASAGDYTLRLKFPDGYAFPSHWHPNGEHLTVVSGTFMLGMGAVTGAGPTTTYKPGDFLYIPGKMPHFGGAKGETVIQLHGQGPFQVMLSNQT
jgi:mannose-6-phosphate isomerase-like protein (cupin superfamily)